MTSYMEANADASRGRKVLILVVVDDGLVHAKRFTNVVGTK